mmetsp:Transcript_11839/g.38914  ORF Transcript_11839/g.38914 Transcript_11839/m.38914 type:complete len:133 (+) Transcript_11839:555-953(+)
MGFHAGEEGFGLGGSGGGAAPAKGSDTGADAGPEDEKEKGSDKAVEKESLVGLDDEDPAPEAAANGSEEDAALDGPAANGSVTAFANGSNPSSESRPSSSGAEFENGAPAAKGSATADVDADIAANGSAEVA